MTNKIIRIKGVKPLNIFSNSNAGGKNSNY